MFNKLLNFFKGKKDVNKVPDNTKPNVNQNNVLQNQEKKGLKENEVYSKEDEEKVKARLRALGYI